MSDNYDNYDIGDTFGPNNDGETLVICPDQDSRFVEQMTIVLGILSVIGGAIGFLMQRRQEQAEAKEVEQKEKDDIDRQQALERARKVMKELVGPLHRVWKVQNTVLMQWRMHSPFHFRDYSDAAMKKGQHFWMKFLPDEYVQPFIEDPQMEEAVMYRNFIKRTYKFLYTRARELVLTHMSNLADMPTQEEWLSRYNPEDVTSPYVGSLNINVIFDSYVAYTLEFDDIIASWEEGCYRRMQPKAKVPFIVCNTLIDMLYDNAKAKEAKYDKHVTVHKNTRQLSIEEQIEKSMAERRNVLSNITEDVQELGEKGKNYLQGMLAKIRAEEEVKEEETTKEEKADEDDGGENKAEGHSSYVFSEKSQPLDDGEESNTQVENPLRMYPSRRTPLGDSEGML